MKINKNSLFNKWVMKMGMGWGQEYEFKEKGINFCEYTRCVFKALLSTLLLTAFCILVVWFIIVITTLMVINPIALFYFDYHLLKGSRDLLELCYILWVVILLLGTIKYGIEFKSYIREKAYMYEITHTEKTESGFVKFCKTWYKSYKEKFCPMVEMTDD